MNATSSKPSQQKPRSGTHIWGGALLVVIGVWSLLGALNVPWANMERLWPVVLIGGGAASLASGLRARPREPGSVWFGVTAILSGGLFLYVTIPGPARWQALGDLWPLFPIFAGLGWVAAWITDLRHTVPLVAGLVAIAIGAMFYLSKTGLIAWDPWALLQHWWPLALIVLGVASLTQALSQREP